MGCYLWLFPLLLLDLGLRLVLVEDSVVILDLAQVGVLGKLHELPETNPAVLSRQLRGGLFQIRILKRRSYVGQYSTAQYVSESFYGISALQPH